MSCQNAFFCKSDASYMEQKLCMVSRSPLFVTPTELNKGRETERGGEGEGKEREDGIIYKKTTYFFGQSGASMAWAAVRNEKSVKIMWGQHCRLVCSRIWGWLETRLAVAIYAIVKAPIRWLLLFANSQYTRYACERIGTVSRDQRMSGKCDGGERTQVPSEDLDGW